MVTFDRTTDRCNDCLFYYEQKEEIVKDDGSVEFRTRLKCKVTIDRYMPEYRNTCAYEIAPARSGTDGWGRDWSHAAQYQEATKPECNYKFNRSQLKEFVDVVMTK